MPKRKPAKKKPAQKKRPSVDKAKAEWHRIYGAAAQVPPEPATVYDWAVQNGRR